MFFFAIIFSIPVLNLIWWHWGDKLLRLLRRARLWRGLLAGFMAVQLVLYASFAFERLWGTRLGIPTAPLAMIYLWNLIIMPASIALTSCVEVVTRSAALARALRRGKPNESAAASSLGGPAKPAGPTRRQILAAACIAAPPLVLTAAVARSVTQLDNFRTRRLRIALPSLPPALDGLTIAHVSDIHVGRFTNGRILDAVVEATNALRADLVLVTGDTIDFALSDLPAGLDMLRRMDPRHGLFMCEGNHDLFQDRDAFEQRVKASGLPLLLNESQLVRVRGEFVQLLGLKWGHLGSHGNLASDELDELLARREAGAFPILLAHHPHAFDAAAAAGVPLTLAGHTHGGQLMLGPNIGVGPLMFKYWSGLYRNNDAALVVSNGVGNWFPLRINAPAEIVHITLTRMS